MTAFLRARRVVCLVLPAAIVVASASAQRVAPSGTRVAMNDATTLDFADADVRTIITAIAEAGNLQVGFGDLPARKYSLHVRRPVGHDSFMALLRSVADANGLTMVERGDLITISGPPPAPPADATGTRRPQVQGSTTVPQRLYVYRLKHANATKLAAVLQSIFAGGGGIQRGGTRRGGGQPQGDQGGQGGQGQSAPLIRFNSQSTDANGNVQSSGNQSFTIGPDGNLTPVDNGDNDNDGGGPPPGLLQLFGGGGGNRANTTRRPVVIVPDESTNSLLVRADADDWDVIRDAIQAVDLRPLQVLIEVVIAEVQHTDHLNVGATGTASNQRTFNGRTLGSAALRGDTTSTSAANFIASLTRYGAVDVNVALAALRSRGDVHVLSRPLVLAENNIQSQLVVGSQRPFVQTSQTFQTGANNQVVQYRDVGTKLTIIPTINPDGYVNLQVQQEVSSATNEIQFGAPVIDNRQATATLFVKDGQTAVVGGLADTQDQETRSGIPILSDIPVLGALFRTTAKAKAKTEFFLFLTPHIVETDSDMNRIRDEIRQRSGLLHTVPTGPIVQSTLDSTRSSSVPAPSRPRSDTGTPLPAQPMQIPGDSTLPFRIVPPGQPSGQP